MALLKQELSGYHFELDSAGIHAENGLGPPNETIAVAKGYGLQLEGHLSKRIQLKILSEAGLILCLDRTQRKALVELAPFVSRRVFTLNEFSLICKSIEKSGALSTGNPSFGDLQAFVAYCSRIRGPVLHEIRRKETLDIEDPFGKSPQCFQLTGAEIATACKTIGSTLRAVVKGRSS